MKIFWLVFVLFPLAAFGNPTKGYSGDFDQKMTYQLSHNEIQIVIKERIEISISEQLKEKNSVSEVGEKRLLATLETVD